VRGAKAIFILSDFWDIGREMMMILMMIMMKPTHQAVNDILKM